jgi:hypothetical protein
MSCFCGLLQKHKEPQKQTFSNSSRIVIFNDQRGSCDLFRKVSTLHFLWIVVAITITSKTKAKRD